MRAPVPSARGRLEVVCDKCGVEAVVLKSVVCRADRERRGTLCSGCYEPLADRLWIVPGLATAFGTCRSCGEWVSVRELLDARLGGKRSAWIGTCTMCGKAS